MHSEEDKYQPLLSAVMAQGGFPTLYENSLPTL